MISRRVRKIPLDSLQPKQPITIPFEDVLAIRLHARVVDFIAKPEKTDELRGLLCKVVIPLLRDQTGFIRSIVLTTYEEQRRVVLITFWSTGERALRDPWEETPLVRELLSPLIDVWSKMRNYKVDVTEGKETTPQPSDKPADLLTTFLPHSQVSIFNQTTRL